ncbi:hypothetical protein ABDF71_21855 [Ochrobactrum sp. WV_118_8]
MALLFIGAEDIDFNFVGGAASSYVDHSSYMQTAYSRVAIRAITRLEGKKTFNTTEAWLHFVSVIGTASQNQFNGAWGFWSPERNDSQVTVQTNPGQSTARLQVYDGLSAYIVSDSFFLPNVSTLSTWDMHVRVDGLSLLVELYNNEVLVRAENFTLLQTYTLTNFRLSHGSYTSSWGWLYSQVIIATEPTLGWKLKTLAPAAAGDLAEFSGTFAGINETTLNNDTKISADESAQSSFKPASWNVPAGFEIAGISLSSYALSDTTAAISNFVRLDGQNYADIPETLNVGWATFRSLWPTNPATGAPWRPTDINGTALQFGIGVTV